MPINIREFNIFWYSSNLVCILSIEFFFHRDFADFLITCRLLWGPLIFSFCSSPDSSFAVVEHFSARSRSTWSWHCPRFWLPWAVGESKAVRRSIRWFAICSRWSYLDRLPPLYSSRHIDTTSILRLTTWTTLQARLKAAIASIPVTGTIREVFWRYPEVFWLRDSSERWKQESTLYGVVSKVQPQNTWRRESCPCSYEN